MEKLAIREEFDFFDIVDDFSGEQDFVIDDALLDEIFSEEENEEDNFKLMDYVNEIVEDYDDSDNILVFYQEYATLFGSFIEHYDNVKLQFPGLYSSIKDNDERVKKLVKVAIRDCPTELLSKMVVANLYDKTYYNNGFLKNLQFLDLFSEQRKGDSNFSDSVSDIGNSFPELLSFAEDILVERERLSKVNASVYKK